MHASAEKVVSAARKYGLEIEVVEFSQTTRTAEDAAAAIGCEVAQIVKSLVFVVNGKPAIALVSGQNMLDTRKLAAIHGFGRKKVKRADAEIVRSATGFSIGGVPPFGHATSLPVAIDEDLNRFDIVWAAAGTPNAVFAISPDDLAAASGGTAADLKVDK